MKRFTKIALIIAAVLATIGIGCIIISFSMGLSWDSVEKMAEAGQISIGTHTFHFWDNGNQSLEKSQDVKQIQQDYQKLEIECEVGDLEIKTADVEWIQVKREGNARFEVHADDEELHIEASRTIGNGKERGKIFILIPNDKRFQEVELDMGAGRATVDGLVTDCLNVELGAGEVVVKKTSVNDMQAEVGAGELQAELIGAEADYGYEIECAVGKIQIGENSYSGIGKTQKNMSIGKEKVIDLECGIGEIKITFTK